MDVTNAPAPATAPTRSTIFFGPFGLRAGWSLLIYFSILALIAGSLWFAGKRIAASQAAAQHAAQPGAAQGSAENPVPLLTMMLFEAFVFGMLFLISFIMARIERRPVGVFGLGGRHSLGRLLLGFLWGVAALSAVVVALVLTHHLTFEGRLQHGGAIFGWGAAQLVAFLLVGFAEEYTYRGYLQFTLTRGLVGLGKLISPTHARALAFAIAGVITCIVFRMAHSGLKGESAIGLMQVFLVGVLLLVTLWRTGSLWWGIGFHGAWDWAQSFLYGVPDSGDFMQGRLFATHPSGNTVFSGGSTGPEGSVFSLVVMLIMIVVVFLIKPSPQPPLETTSLRLKPRV